MVVVRTKTSALRVHELVHSIFGGDPRIRVFYVFDPGSEFNGWLPSWAVEQEVQAFRWEEGLEMDYDLVITFSENIDYSRLSTSVFLFAHGLGNNKWIPARDGDSFSLSGLPPSKMLKAGLTFVVTHPTQVEQLIEALDGVVPRFLVAGDVSFAILRASLESRHVERYRRRLQTGSRKLILVSSTWGIDAILGASPELLAQLLAQLPVDSYQIVFIAHCNEWTRDGGDELRRKLQGQLRAGLVLVPPKYWHSVVASADLVVTDHGSISLFAVSAGKPVILGTFSETEVVAETCMAELGDIARRMSLAKPLLPQVEAAITGHDPMMADYFTRRIFAHPDDGGRIARDHLYAELGLPPLDEDLDVLAAPLPEVDIDEVRSYDTEDRRDPDSEIVLSRTPRGVRIGIAPPQGSHLVAHEFERNPKFVADASVIIRTEPSDDLDAWLKNPPAAGCLLAAAKTADATWIVRVCSDTSPFFDSRFVLTSIHATLPSEALPSVLVRLMRENRLPSQQVEENVRLGPYVDRVIIRPL